MIRKKEASSTRISDVISKKLSHMLLAGTFKSGDKLPTERELTEELQTSRSSVRSALSTLESQGLIVRVQGGGTYVSDKIEASFTDPIIELFHQDQHFKYDLLEYRHALEEACCFHAAIKGTDEEKAVIQQKYDEWSTLHNSDCTAEELAAADLAFHLAIADATHNALLPHAMRSSLSIIEHSMALSLKSLYPSKSKHQITSDQHKTILKAILESDGNAAREAVRTHLDFILVEVEKADIQMLRDEQALSDKKMFK